MLSRSEERIAYIIMDKMKKENVESLQSSDNYLLTIYTYVLEELEYLLVVGKINQLSKLSRKLVLYIKRVYI